MPLVHERLKRIFGGIIYALVSCQVVAFFVVERILYSDWGHIHVAEPNLFRLWYPIVAALTAFFGWYDRKAGLWCFGAVLVVRVIENLLTPNVPDFNWDLVIVGVFSPMAMALPFALLCKFFMFLERAPDLEVKKN